MHTLLLALQLAATQAAPSPVPQHVRDSIWSQVDSVVQAFQLEWRVAWAYTQNRLPIRDGPRNAKDKRAPRQRLVAMHCHDRGGPAEISLRRTQAVLERFIVGNGVPGHASCPLWYPADDPPVRDERLELDGALAAELRGDIVRKRLELRRYLERAAEQLPQDIALLGQRVRFALDGGAQADAWQIAQTCERDAAECGLLRAWVLQRGGHAAAADSAFTAAIGSMNAAERCQFRESPGCWSRRNAVRTRA